MITGRHITKITVIMMAVALILCLTVVLAPAEALEVFGESKVSMEYASRLFDREEIIHMDIRMEEEDWEEMLEHAMEETYYSCEVVINGTTFEQVGIRTKGNTSLSSIVSDPENDRYSFKLEFDRFVSDQTCWGLDKLVLNNNYADATNMKEAIVYDMYRFLDTDASLYNYAEISVNGSYWGVYLALEAVEESFLLRNYGVENGSLYKPEGMDGGGNRAPGAGEAMAFGDGAEQGRRNREEMQEREREGGAEDPWPDAAGGKAGPGGRMMGAGSGADLNYTDDDPESYTTIWEGAVTGSTQASRKRVVEALKHISEHKDPEKYMDVDNLLKYMAVHSFSVNEDSLSGNMAHNYYLYESEGRLNILPWDYNLAFGGMGGRGAQGNAAGEVINDPIDSPFSGTDFFDVLLEDEEYLERYHRYYRRLAEEYVCGGVLDESFSRIRSQIDGLVKTDPNAMYSYGEYEEGAQTLYKLINLRAQSVLGQLDGTIPSTEEGQRADSSALIDASAIDLETMGSFMGGGGPGGAHGWGRESENGHEGEGPEDFSGSGNDGEMRAAPETEREKGEDLDPFPGNFDPENDFPRDFEPPAIPASASAQSVGGRGENIRLYAGCLLLILLLSIFIKYCPIRRRR